ncbi:hypothetical protein QZH41_016620, partial [Actinostola sp. cb2023]
WFSKMATFGWSYKNNVSGVKRPKELKRKAEEWQKDREDVKIPLHSQTHSSESVNAGMKRRRYHPRAKIFVGNLNKDTKPVTLAEYFSFFGEIAYMKMIKDRETGVSRGFAFITFVEVADAEKSVRWCRGNHPVSITIYNVIMRVDGKEIKVGSAERRQRPMVQNQQGLIVAGNTGYKERRDTHTLYWEYKWTQDLESEVYGPYETGLMLQWYKMGYFSSGCWVRQAQRITAGHDKKAQIAHDDETNENQPKLASLVDSYSSSSDDEETTTQRTKTESTLHQRVNSLTEHEIHDNVVNENSTSENQPDNQTQRKTQEDGNIKQTFDKQIISKECRENDSENDEVEESDGHEGGNGSTVVDSSTSWYQANRGGCKARDILGRDSSSEDEDYNVEDLDQQLIQNEFIHIGEIDFSMFP